MIKITLIDRYRAFKRYLFVTDISFFNNFIVKLRNSEIINGLISRDDTFILHDDEFIQNAVIFLYYSSLVPK